eukprot:TRINITY_DN2824_c0_g2_i2.p1 TRINITY_DN2824_c0_g2~~TRINITY_DN2824_c0_g2_i2.p1  ORF type:complete len:57 (-),score=6.42 TRINITY_DN2824_c0_g2_i2:159-329(-)
MLYQFLLCGKGNFDVFDLKMCYICACGASKNQKKYRFQQISIFEKRVFILCNKNST